MELNPEHINQKKKPNKKSNLDEGAANNAIDVGDVVKMEDKMIDWDCANKVKDEFLALYPKIADEIRPQYFKKLLEIMNEKNITFEMDAVCEIARKSFSDSLTEQFNKLWIAQRMPFNLSQVNILKEAWKKEKNPKWRPTGKTVAEQTLPIRCQMLEAKKNFLLKQWDEQNIRMQTLVEELNKKRATIDSFMKRREELLFKMDINSDKLENIKKVITKKQLEVLDSLEKD